jgi:hypothetical protein
MDNQSDHSPDEEPLKLSPEQMEMLKEGDESFERGEGFTFEQVMEHARAKVRAWLPPSQSA